jgi:hypothetical protein
MIPQYQPRTAPSPSDAESPSLAPPVPIAQSPRYAYLVGRLRSRQITMEEATELFEAQQRAVAAMSIPPPPPPPSAMSAPPRAAPAGTISVLTDDALIFGLVGLGAAAGLLAALLRRSQELRSPPAGRGKALSR